MNNHQIVEYTIALLSRLMGELETQAFEQEGFSDLSIRQLLYLETLSRMHRPTFSQLAEELEVTMPSVSAIVKKLIRMGYVKKEQSQQDRRIFYIVLTPKGERFNKIHGEVHQLLAARITQNLDIEELQLLTALLEKVIPA